MKAKHKFLSQHGLAQPPFPQDLLIQGLAEIRASYPSTFCSKRIIGLPKPGGHKENPDREDQSGVSGDDLAEPQLEVPDREPDLGVGREEQGLLIPSASVQSNVYEVSRENDLMNRVVGNPSARPLLVHVANPDRKYRIPPCSVFMLSKVGQQEASDFSRAATKIFPELSISAAPGQFDVILLDPPWENKSARRSKTYGTRRKADVDPMQVLREMLGRHMAPEALIACWITNKASVRDAALQTFEAWGVDLVEEWAWLKTTVHGEPICDIDGSVRRPYETVLVGRTADVMGNSASKKSITKRLMVGVPDFHSRKPCLKEIIEPLLRDRTDYRALEIFARNLTAGWWSWGDEVLKYNWEGCWASASAQDSRDLEVGMEDGHEPQDAGDSVE